MAIAVGIGERIAPDCTPKGSSAYCSEQKGLFCTPKALSAGRGEQITPDCTPEGSSARRREQEGPFRTPKALSAGRGEQIAPDCTPEGSSAHRREQKGLFCTQKAIAACLGEQIAPNCTPKGFSAYCREQRGLFCTPKELATGIGEQKVAVCTPLGRLRRRRDNSFRSGWRKRERHRSLDGELLLIRATRARNVRQTKRRHGLKRAAGFPAALSSMATAPCTGPPTSLFRQFAPELFLLHLRLPVLSATP